MCVRITMSSVDGRTFGVAVDVLLPSLEALGVRRVRAVLSGLVRARRLLVRHQRVLRAELAGEEAGEVSLLLGLQLVQRLGDVSQQPEVHLHVLEVLEVQLLLRGLLVHRVAEVPVVTLLHAAPGVVDAAGAANISLRGERRGVRQWNNNLCFEHHTVSERQAIIGDSAWALTAMARFTLADMTPVEPAFAPGFVFKDAAWAASARSPSVLLLEALGSLTEARGGEFIIAPEGLIFGGNEWALAGTGQPHLMFFDPQ